MNLLLLVFWFLRDLLIMELKKKILLLLSPKKISENFSQLLATIISQESLRVFHESPRIDWM